MPYNFRPRKKPRKKPLIKKMSGKDTKRAKAAKKKTRDEGGMEMKNVKKNPVEETRTEGERSEDETDEATSSEDEGNEEGDVQNQILKIVKGLESRTKRIEKNISDIEKKVDCIETEINCVKQGVHTAQLTADTALQSTENLETHMQLVNTELEMYKTRCDNLEVKLKHLHENQLASDSYSRKENLVFYGIPVTKDEDCSQKIRQVVKDNLKIASADQMIFQRCHRLSTRSKSVPPIICRFLHFEDREAVWRKRMSLKDTKIYLAENFAPEIESRRRALYPILQAAKKKGVKATLKYDKIIIDGVSYSHDTVASLPPDLNPANIATETKQGITCFFTGASPLSNFYLADFTLHGEKYDCVERCFQRAKALFAECPLDAQKIQQATIPAQCKALGDRLKVNETAWLAKAKRIMNQACRAKFSQNELCKHYLMKTLGTDIAEAGPDETWGIGIKKSDERAFQKNAWKGQNLLGDILMAIRDEL